MFLAAASPPDVRHLLKQESIMKLDAIRRGFAAGCEAGLRPAVQPFKGLGYALGSGLALNDWGRARTRGIAPTGK